MNLGLVEFSTFFWIFLTSLKNYPTDSEILVSVSRTDCGNYAPLYKQLRPIVSTQIVVTLGNFFFSFSKVNKQFSVVFLLIVLNYHPKLEILGSMKREWVERSSCVKVLTLNFFNTKNIWPSEKSMIWSLVRFFWTFDFLETTQSDIKGLIKTTVCKKPPCVNCYALKIWTWNNSVKIPK